MARSTSSKASNDATEKSGISVTEAVKNYGIYVEEQKVALQDARQLIEKLQADYNQLRLERDSIQQEAFSSTEFFEADLKQKKELIQDLETKLAQKETENASIRKQFNDEITATATASKMEKAEFINHIAKIEKELYSLQHFSEHKAQLEGKLADAKKENAQLIERHKVVLAEVERKYIEQGNNMKKDYERSLEEINCKLHEEIEDRVGQRVRNILAENERLGDEIRMHVELTTSLRKDIDILQAEAAGVCRDIDLLREADNLHIQRSSNQARVIAQSNTKVVTLEKSIGSVVRQYGAERRALEEEHQKVLNDFEVERQTLHRIIQTKTKELRKVKQLAQQVLHERGEVEAFLVDSLDIVLQELRDSKSSTPLVKGVLKKKADRKPATASQGSARSGQSTPKQHSSTSSRSKRPQKAGSMMDREAEMDILQQLEEVPVKLEPTVDISQLSWHDREKVLRYLFAKINQAHQIPNHVAVTHNRAKYQELFSSDDESEDLQMALFGSVSDGGRVLV